LFAFDIIEIPEALVRLVMKKWLLVALAALLLSGCSFKQVWKWIEDADWEGDDQTIRIVHFLMR